MEPRPYIQNHFRIVIKLVNGGSMFVETTNEPGVAITPRIVLRRKIISFGCRDIEVQALKKLLEMHNEKFGNEEIVIQQGEET